MQFYILQKQFINVVYHYIKRIKTVLLAMLIISPPQKKTLLLLQGANFAPPL